MGARQLKIRKKKGAKIESLSSREKITLAILQFEELLNWSSVNNCFVYRETERETVLQMILMISPSIIRISYRPFQNTT